VGRGQSTVSRILRNYDYKTFNCRDRSHIHKRKTTKHKDRILTRTAKVHDDQAYRDIIHISGLPISRNTLRRRLKEINLHSRIRRRKPVLKPSHKAARLSWARKHQHWTIQDWQRVIWSDESAIVLGQRSRRRRCIRKNGQAFLPRYCDGTVKAGRVTMMVWACFTGSKVGPLIVCDAGSVNADRYLDILRDGVITFTNDLLNPPPGADSITVATDDTLLFMHDNAPCHTARKVTQYLKNRRLPTMKWLAQSPDLNPIENLWVDLKDRFHKAFWSRGLRPSTNRNTLERCAILLKELWHEQGMELINKLIESMPKRVAAVIAGKGGHTKY
jgi:transposase/DDE superfamily endonuclease